MPRLLASYPLSWILAMGASADASQAELLFNLLENDGAARITLGPLDLAAQVALVGDVLGAIPDQGLIELAPDAAGNPLVLAEAFRGLRDENAIVVRGGHASLAPAHVTSRIEALGPAPAQGRGSWRAPGRKEPPRSCAPGSPWRRAGSTTRTRWPSRP